MTEDEETCEASEFSPLLTPRLTLRTPHEDNAPAIAELANDRRVADMVSSLPHPYGIEDADLFIDGAQGRPVFVVNCRKDGRLMGVASLRFAGRTTVAELGYWLGHTFWNQGYATEAAHAVIDFGFRDLHLDLIEVSCRAVNNASRRVIQKCGFQYSGTGMSLSLAAGSVAVERYRMDKGCWTSLKEWGRT
ncbi:GNAT family N-acetyltransferase [Consotaella aegiceratis]|uniref:GNAT family N-acetyltransferase n=1 Tax=Consotaella aegiceratis TaxID=3097961 RepID=UPI002F3F9E8A